MYNLILTRNIRHYIIYFVFTRVCQNHILNRNFLQLGMHIQGQLSISCFFFVMVPPVLRKSLNFCAIFIINFIYNLSITNTIKGPVSRSVIDMFPCIIKLYNITKLCNSSTCSVCLLYNYLIS